MAIEHPEPTVTTVKFLYAHAFRCAYEGCRRPLYRVDEQTGDRLLNSRVCHINARREGGPRWEPTQTADKNRSKDNLILMCLEHAAAIDEPTTVSKYPPSLLHDWKKKQLAEYDQLLQGWKIDTTMAREARDAPNAEMIITGSILRLGGEGGKGPGAGGGGGGAIGRSARAGRGGDGGDFRIDGGGYTLPIVASATDAFPEGCDLDFVPGGGGGGAGVIGDGAGAGDGGGGGERVTGLIDLVALRAAGLDHVEITVGQGGNGASLPGQHGATGDDTVLNFVTKDGTLLKSIRAAGGAVGRSAAARLPDDVFEISIEDINTGFRVPVLMTANAADFREGLVFVLGGGWLNFAVPKLPIDATWLVVCRAGWRGLDESPRGLFLSLLKPNGKEVACQALVLRPERSGLGAWTWTQLIGATIDVEGTWTLKVHSGGFLLAEIDINVICTAAPRGTA